MAEPTAISQLPVERASNIAQPREAMLFAALTLAAPLLFIYARLMLLTPGDQMVAPQSLLVLGAFYSALCLVHFDTAFYLLIFFIPLQFKGVSIGDGILSVTDFMIAALALVWVVRCLIGLTAPRLNCAVALLLVWLVIAAVSAFQSIDRGASVRQLLRLLSCGVALGLTVNEVYNRRRLIRTITILVWSSAFVSAYGLYEYFYLNRNIPLLTQEAINTHKRIVTVFNQSNVTAGFLVVVAGMVMLLYIRSHSRAWKLAYGGIFILNMAAVGLTFSRSGWLCMALVLLLLPFRVRARLFLCGVLIAVVAASSLAYNLTSRQRSINERLDIYERAWMHIKHRPLLGYGPGTTTHLSLSQRETRSGQIVTLNAHNLYLTVLLETGMFGMAALMVLVASLWIGIVQVVCALRRAGPAAKHEHLTVWCLAATMAAILLIRFFQTGMLQLSMWVGFGLIAALPAVYKGAPDASRDIRAKAQQ